MKLPLTTATVLSALSLLGASCASMSASAGSSQLAEPNLPPYEGPRASIALRKFDWKVGQENGFSVTGPDGQVMSWSVSHQRSHVGGLEDLLTTALVKSKRFQVLERMQFDETKEEVGLQEEGWVREGSGPVKGQAKGADLGIYASVTEWNEDAGGSSTRGGALGFVPKFFGFGGIGLSKKKGVCGISVRIVDLNTSETLASENIQGVASSSGFTLGGIGLGGGLGIGGALSQYEDTPMGAAIQKAIGLAVEKIVDGTPEEYFRHS